MAYPQGSWPNGNGRGAQDPRLHAPGSHQPVQNGFEFSTNNQATFANNNFVNPAQTTLNGLNDPSSHPLPPVHQPAQQNGPIILIESPKHRAATKEHAAQAPTQAPPLDYQLLLLSLADEYLAAARGQGSMAALYRREADTAKYYQLIATGLGCLEAVLKVTAITSSNYNLGEGTGS